ncbi:hypothetical protein AWENTII_002701 [Aspergillus wentii]
MALLKKSLLALFGAGLLPSALAKLVKFDLDLTWQTGSTNGNPREMVFMNGEFPGPPLILDQYDDVEFYVYNHLPFQVTVHFHGIEMLNTPWSDGVPGLSQKPIEPGDSFIYKWKATQYGTYWYHSHARTTLMDGLYGPIWINPAPGTPNPFHLISNDTEDLEAMHKAESNPNLMTLSDWSHLTSEEFQAIQIDSGMDLFCMDSILINGRGSVYCPGEDFIASLETDYLKGAIDNQPLTDKGCYPNIYKTQGDFPNDESKIPAGVNSGCVPADGPKEVIEVDAADGWASFKFISAASLKSLIVSIDEHPMWIYEVDGHYIEPQLVHMMSMFNGERYSAMVKLDKTPKDYTIRVPDTNDLGESKGYVDYGGQNTTADVIPLDLKTLWPYPHIPIAQHADQLINLTMGRMNSSYQWTLEGSALYDIEANYDHPILHDLSAQQYEPERLVISTKNGTWVDVLLQLGVFPHTPPIQAPHVIHKHSNKAFIIGFGVGFFNWTTVDEAIAAQPDSFELEHPQLRDTFVSNGPTGPAWMLIRYPVVNPGPFLMHCHIETHLGNGMGVALLDGPESWPQVPPEYAI